MFSVLSLTSSRSRAKTYLESTHCNHLLSRISISGLACRANEFPATGDPFVLWLVAGRTETVGDPPADWDRRTSLRKIGFDALAGRVDSLMSRPRRFCPNTPRASESKAEDSLAGDCMVPLTVADR